MMQKKEEEMKKEYPLFRTLLPTEDIFCGGGGRGESISELVEDLSEIMIQ